MTITLTPMPAGHSLHSLLPNTDPTTGVITFTARPSRHAWAVSQTMLEAFGVRSDVFGAGRAHGEDLTLLRAWIRAYDIRLVVVRHATNLRDFDLLDSLLLLCEEAGVHLALTCDDNTGTHLFDWVEQHGGEINDDEIALTALVSKHTRPISGTPDIHGSQSFPVLLPRVDFYGFRARCRDTLSPGQFETVDRVYREVFREVQRDPFGTKEEAATRLAAMCSLHQGVGQVRTLIRAAQAAMFTRGVLLKVSLDTFLNLVHDAQHRRLTHSEVLALRAYRTPWRSSVIVLRDCNLSREEIHRLSMSDVADDGTLRATGAWPVPNEANVYLRAQRFLRQSAGASGDDPFITEDQTTVALAQRRAGAELGLPGTRGIEFKTTRAADRWQHELGVAMLPLVAAHLPNAETIKGSSA